MKFCQCSLSLVFALFVSFILPIPAGGTALDDYVAAPDSNYSYVEIDSDSDLLTTAYTLELTSQGWRNSSEVNPVVWTHWVTIYKPRYNFLITTDKVLILISDGNNADTDPAPPYDDQFRQLSIGTGSVIAVLSAVPNQPLQFSDEMTPRSEDEIIAYSWDKFLRGGDANWPAQLPMVKSVVRCMDAVQDFMDAVTGGAKPVNQFILTGGSKRGWTAWLTAAVDPDNRVTAIAPIVSDLLNMKRSFAHHWAAYGFWADALWPYEEIGIFDRFDAPLATQLLEIVDPFEYRDRLQMPKFIINSAGDDFFVMDSIQFYIDGLLGETYLRYVPNTDHYLTGAFDDVLNSMVPYYDAFLNGYSRPEFSSSLERDGSIIVETVDTPKAVYLWQASNPATRDFRLVTIGTTWVSSPLVDEGGGVYVGRVGDPNSGWTAFFVELIYESPFQGPDAYDYHFTTQMRVLPEILPFEADFNRDRMTDILDLAILSEAWLTRNAYRDIAPRRGGDGTVNLYDFGVLALHWLEDNKE
ncbi:MAG: PhoPQ-activated protein PqaA family protein [Planctomycetota bacterium]|jgi:PhoPQ-activated pathogenicity-related protein